MDAKELEEYLKRIEGRMTKIEAFADTLSAALKADADAEAKAKEKKGIMEELFGD